MLEKYITESTPLKLVTVRTSDKNGRTKECCDLFRRELDALSEALGRNLCIETEILVPPEENEYKEKNVLKELFACFEKESYVYMDLTYGTKLTSIEMFSSLYFAEIVEKCNIKSVVYGQSTFNGSSEGELYDATRLYHTVRFLDAAAQMDRKCFENLIQQMLTEYN